MTDKEKTQAQLIEELGEMRRRIAELESSETERRQGEEELRTVNRALKAISECNQALVRASEESELLGDICRIIVQVGGYRLAWVGFAEEDEEKRVRPVAQEGYEEGYLDWVNITWADTERGRGPTGTAIRTGTPSVNRNVLTNPDYAPWRTEALKRGYASSIALPLTATGRTFGALNIYAVKPDAFDAEEVRLLTELANDLAYGIVALRTRADHMWAEKALRASEERYRAIVEDQTELICRWRPRGILTFVNDAYCRYFGKRREELVGHSFLSLIPEEDHEKVTKHFETLTRDNPIQTQEHRVVARDRGVCWQQWTNRAIFDDDGHLVEYQSVGRDITERKRAEEKIEASLKEKEVLLKEIHHRVKNNLQVISGLLLLQSRDMTDTRTVEMLKEFQNRIKSMAIVHEKLYRSKDLARVDFGEYVRTVAADLLRSYEADSEAVTVEMSVEDSMLDIDTAIPCGLILNELLSNALKHAFPGSRRGRVRIDFRCEEAKTFVLTVSDNGVGLPEDVDIRTASTLGLQLVSTLTDQLRGTVELDRRGGTACTISFKPLFV